MLIRTSATSLVRLVLKVVQQGESGVEHADARMLAEGLVPKALRTVILISNY